MVCVYAKNAVGIGDKMMKIKTLILYTLLSLSMCGTVYAGPIVHRDGAVIPSGATLDIVDIDDGNVPAMQAAGAGFGESPIWRTDANTVTLKSATGQSITLAFNADNGEDNSDKWKLVAADGGNVTLQTYASGAWVTVAIWTNAGGLTLTGAIAGATVNTGQGAYELYAMNQDLESTDSVSFATITEGANAVPNATDPLSFFAATTSAQLAGVLSDETGTLKSVFSDSPTFTTQITTPAITAPAASLAIKPTTDAVNAVQVQDKDGNNILNVDTVNNRVGIGTTAPDYVFNVVGPDGSYLASLGNAATGGWIGIKPDGTNGHTFRIGGNGTGINILKFVGSGDVEFMRLNSGNVGIGTTSPDTTLDIEGNARASTGILFGTDTAAANTLDDYEEGTWTPVLSDGTNNATMDATFTFGGYTKIGNNVTLTGRVATTSLGSVSGDIRITGVPFANGIEYRNTNAISIAFSTGLAITAGHVLTGDVVISTVYIRLSIWDATTGATAMQHSEWSDNGTIGFTATYSTS